MGEASNPENVNVELGAVGRSDGVANITEGSPCALHKRSEHFIYIVKFSPHENL